MAEKVKSMIRNNLVLCVLVLVGIFVTTVVYAADVKVKAGKVKGNLRIPNDTYLTARNAADTGDVNLIKANTSDVAVIPDGSELATSAAPTADADIANKKYVDDSVGTWTPSSYTGGESVTFPNGLIFKHGFKSGSGRQTVTFAQAFPNSAISASVIVVENTNDTRWNGKVKSLSTTSLVYFQQTGVGTGSYWQVWGY